MHFKVMCLIALGEQVSTVNGDKITEKQKKTAKDIEQTVFKDLFEGKVLGSTLPRGSITEVSQKTIKLVEPKSPMSSKAPKNINYGSKDSLALICEKLINGEMEIPENFRLEVSNRMSLIRKEFPISEEKIENHPEECSIILVNSVNDIKQEFNLDYEEDNQSFASDANEEEDARNLTVQSEDEVDLGEEEEEVYN